MHPFRSIQTLRLVTALAVVAFHASGARFVPGAAGIDIFFVISGFVMGAAATAESPRLFLVKRFARIVPLYWAATLTLCALAAFGLAPRTSYDAERLWKSLAFLPYRGTEGDMVPLLVQGWTLNYEVVFYLVFALGLALRAPIRVTVALLLALALGGLLGAPNLAPLEVWTSPILLEFAAGLALATVVKPKGARIGCAMLTLGGAVFVYIGWFSAFDPPFRLLSAGLPSLLIVCGALAIERAGAWPRVFRWIEPGGQAAYALYLLHGFVIGIGHRLIGDGLIATACIVLAAFGVAFASYHLFERPLARLLIGLAVGRTRGPAAGQQAETASRLGPFRRRAVPAA